MKILVSGAGIAGLTSAYWLNYYGFDVVLIERSPEIRDEGYLIDFYGEGVQVAKAMGILYKLHSLSTNLRVVEIVEANGQKVGGFQISDIRAAMEDSNSDYIPLMRGDLERTLYEALPSDVELRFNTVVTAIDNSHEDAKVTFSDGRVENFDIVIGAEGIHSSTRELLFGPEEQFKVSMGAFVAIVRLKGAGKSLDGAVKTNMSIGNFLAVAPTRNGDLIGVFAFYSTENKPQTQEASLDFLRRYYGENNQFTSDLLDQITPETYIFLDEVSQIRMPQWCKGRVALVGDSSACLTLLSGQGSLMAMTESYVLARELWLAQGRHTLAFKAYEDILMPVIAQKAVASAKVSLLIPKNWLHYMLFKFVFRFLKYPYVQKKVFAAYMKPTVFDKAYPLEC